MRPGNVKRKFISLLSSWKDAEEGGYAIVGSPETVRQKLREGIKAAGCGILQGIFQVGSMPHEMAMKNMELFAKEVMPAIRAEFPLIGEREARARRTWPALCVGRWTSRARAAPRRCCACGCDATALPTRRPRLARLVSRLSSRAAVLPSETADADSVARAACLYSNNKGSAT